MKSFFVKIWLILDPMKVAKSHRNQLRRRWFQELDSAIIVCSRQYQSIGPFAEAWTLWLWLPVLLTPGFTPVSHVFLSWLRQSRKVFDLSSQVGLMRIAIDGREGYCASLEYAMDKVFHHAAKWTVTEGVGALFARVLGVGGISTGSDGLVRMVTRIFLRYAKPDSAQYASLCLLGTGSEWSKLSFSIPWDALSILSTYSRSAGGLYTGNVWWNCMFYQRGM